MLVLVLLGLWLVGDEVCSQINGVVLGWLLWGASHAFKLLMRVVIQVMSCVSALPTILGVLSELVKLDLATLEDGCHSRYCCVFY